MPLILSSDLVGDPPSQNLAIRYVTLEAKTGLLMRVVLEVDQEYKDIYYKYTKQVGLMDFIDEYVTPEEKIDGIRIDSKLEYPKTIKVSSINFQNTLNILGQVKSLKEIL
tara:strand:- start:162 stop:491 length:330 start_codon:yes stop_codon:yes gene_type:complete